MIMEKGSTDSGVGTDSSKHFVIIKEKICKVLDKKSGIKECELSKLDEILNGKNVTRLDLSGCLISEFPFNLCCYDFITELNLSGNQLQRLPDEFTNLKKIRVLNIANNLFDEFPSVLYNSLYVVKTLNVSNNRITTIDKIPCCLPTLQHLDLSSNRLYEPPFWLHEDVATSLEYIDLSNNPCFEQFEMSNSCSSKVIENIKILKMSECKFRNSLSSYFRYFRRLHTLILSNKNRMSFNFHNSLVDITELPISLERLEIADVGLSHVETITSLTNLRHLDISYNSIYWIPSSVKSLKYLITLKADHCKLGSIPSEINELINLKELYLGSNELKSYEFLENLVNIEVLDLFGNSFTSLPDLRNFSKLVALDLCQNYIEPPTYIEVNHKELSYKDLKKCLRSKIPCTGRLDGAVEVEITPEEELVDDFSDHSSEEFNTSGLGDSAPVDDASFGVGHCTEVWELDENEDFDPNIWSSSHVSCFARSKSNESLTGETPYEVTTHPHFYTPYQSVSSIIASKSSLPLPVEGQFDD